MDITRKKIYLFKLNIMYIKLDKFCELTQSSIHLRNIAIIITNKVYKHKFCKKHFTDWYYILLASFFIASKFYEDIPISINELFRIEIYQSKEFFNTDIEIIKNGIKKMEIIILKMLNYKIPRHIDAEIENNSISTII